MHITRRDFLRYCSLTAAGIGLSAFDLGLLEKALAAPGAPTVLWLQGSCCTGCSVSLLNRIASTAPKTAAALLTDTINLAFHVTLMGLAGESAAAEAYAVKATGNYVLVVEGGIPRAFGGAPCFAWHYKGHDYTFREVVEDFVPGALAVVCAGTCASWGGMSAAPPNITDVVGVKALTGRTTINVAGCPAHPDWIVWTVAQLLAGQTVALDSSGRPQTLFAKTVHSQCPRREAEETESYGADGLCLEEIGCRGPSTYGNCPVLKWNGGINWCVTANAPCIGCTESWFPGTRRLA